MDFLKNAIGVGERARRGGIVDEAEFIGYHLVASKYTPSVYLDVAYPVLPSISAERNPASPNLAR
jgi:hypothetical protein